MALWQTYLGLKNRTGNLEQTQSTSEINMNSLYNPYGVIPNIGPGQTPLYTASGRYSRRWGRIVQHHGQTGWNYNRTVLVDPNWPAAQPYSDRQMAQMQAQLEFDGDREAFAWQTSMMSQDEMMRELSRFS